MKEFNDTCQTRARFPASPRSCKRWKCLSPRSRPINGIGGRRTHDARAFRYWISVRKSRHGFERATILRGKDWFLVTNATARAIVFCLTIATTHAQTQAQPATAAARVGPGRANDALRSPRHRRVYPERMRKHHVPGVSLAIVRRGQVVLAKGYGQANVELAVPATEDTVYQLASVTKTFTAAAIMLLVEERQARARRQCHQAPVGPA